MGGALRIVTLIAACAIALFMVLGAWVNAQGLAPEELARRCAACQPIWSSYQEDVKAIHAPTVAKWQGEPEALLLTPGTLEARFRMDGFWASTVTGIPLLLRTPEGDVIRSDNPAPVDGLQRYTFTIPKSATVYPWIELHYPHVERRFPLDESGQWHPGNF